MTIHAHHPASSRPRAAACCPPSRRWPPPSRSPLPAHAQQKVKVGLMLPYTGTYAQLGVAITNGFKLAIEENGGKVGGREIEYVTLDDESDPAKAADNANRLVNRDKVDVLVGTVHSGVQAGMVKIARETGVLHIIPNAGARRRDRTAVRAEHLPHLVRQRPDQLSDGQGARRARREERRHADLEVRGGRRERRRLQGCVHQGRRQDRQGADAAVPERRVPAAADRDRVAQARRGVRVLRRRRRGQVPQGLPGRGPEGQDPAVRLGLPHRRHPRGGGRRGRRHRDDAALRRRDRHARATRRSAPRMRRPTRSSRTSTPCRATTRACCSSPA